MTLSPRSLFHRVPLNALLTIFSGMKRLIYVWHTIHRLQDYVGEALALSLLHPLVEISYIT